MNDNVKKKWVVRQDPEQMDNCEAYTLKGEPCPYRARTKSEEIDKNVCNIHSET